MSDKASIRSNDGTASEYSDISLDPVKATSTPLRPPLASNEANLPLTKKNLKKNNSTSAKQKRLKEAPGKVGRIAAAYTQLSGDKLPEKTIKQLREDKSGFDPMERFLETEDDLPGGRVNERVWDYLAANDPLAAELDAMCK